MPMPPALATVLAYCSVRNERHTPPAPPPPNGPSPSMPVNIWLNIELRNMDSKSTALARALAATSGFLLVPAGAPRDPISGLPEIGKVLLGLPGIGNSVAAVAVGEARGAMEAITSPRSRHGSRRRP